MRRRLQPSWEQMDSRCLHRSHSPTYAGLCCPGFVLCSARAMGEFGAVSVLSGHLRGLTNTMPTHIPNCCTRHLTSQEPLAMSSILVIMAVIILILRNILEHRGNKEGGI